MLMLRNPRKSQAIISQAAVLRKLLEQQMLMALRKRGKPLPLANKYIISTL
jgi:hypothetical protein